MDLKNYLLAERGRSRKLAAALGVSQAVVSQWVTGVKQVPAQRCPAIERATGIRCEDIRPDVEWSVLRGKRSRRAEKVAA